MFIIITIIGAICCNFAPAKNLPAAMKKYLAYTLIEALVTCAVIGGLATGAYLIVSNVSESSARSKLEQDVRMVNRALRVYQTHGGKIPSGMTGDAILAK